MLGRVSASTWDGSAGYSQSEYGIHAEHVTVGPGSEHACGCYVEFFTGWAVVPDAGGVLVGVVVPDGGGAASGTAASATGFGNAEKVLRPESKGKQIQWGRPGLQEEHGLQSKAVSETLSIVCRSLHCESCVASWFVQSGGATKGGGHASWSFTPVCGQGNSILGTEETPWNWFGGLPGSCCQRATKLRPRRDSSVWTRPASGCRVGLGERRPRVELGRVFPRGRGEASWWKSTEEAGLFKWLCWVVKCLTLTCTYCSEVFGPWVAPKCWVGPLEEAERRMPPMELWIDGASCSIEAQGFKILENAVWVWSGALGPPSYHSTVFRNVFYLLPGQLKM